MSLTTRKEFRIWEGSHKEGAITLDGTAYVHITTPVLEKYNLQILKETPVEGQTGVLMNIGNINYSSDGQFQCFINVDPYSNKDLVDLALSTFMTAIDAVYNV